MHRPPARISWQQRSVRRRRLLHGVLSFGLGVVGLTLVGCGGDDDDEPAPRAETEPDAQAQTEQHRPEPVDQPAPAAVPDAQTQTEQGAPALADEPTPPGDTEPDAQTEPDRPEPADAPAETPSGEPRTFTPSADTTLYRENDNSNGAGEHIFTGLTNGAQERRALLRFDLRAIPAGAIVTQAELTLALSRTSSGTIPLSLHRLTRDWGEAGSDAPGTEGRGTAAAIGDATWNHARFDTEPWTAPGGDFVATPSATTSVLEIGPYTWRGAGLVADVQAWLDGDAPNHGWILLADELIQPSTKRFDSRESASPPRLAVTIEAG